MNTTKKSLLAAMVGLFAAGGMGTVQAQEQVGESARAQGVLDEIVVTAQKREASMQEVPIAITAFTGDRLAKSGIAESKDLVMVTPGLNFATIGALGKITIRGVGAGLLQGPGADPSAGLYVDGVYQSRFNSATFDIIDVERIEILKGPQGTLYGRNSNAGAIKLISKKPTNDVGGDFTFGAGNYDMRSINGSINMPIIEDELLLRVFGARKTRDGYTENIFISGDQHDRDDLWAGGFALKYVPNENLDILINGRAINDDGDFAAEKHFIDPNGTFYGAAQQISDPRKVAADFGPRKSPSRVRSIDMTVNWDLEDMQLTSITGYSRGKFGPTELDVEATELVGLTQGNISGAGDGLRRDHTTISQELVLSSSSESDFEWLGGLYLMRDEPFILAGLAIPQFSLPFVQTAARNETNAYAAFGHGSYKFSDSLRLNVGVRYSYEKKEISRSQFTDNVLTRAEETQEESWSEISPKIGLDYFLSDKTMVYISVTEGFKSGAFQTSNFDADPADPETTTAFELGLKTSLLDDKLRANFSAFYYDYKDLQIQTLVQDTDGSLSTVFSNAGESTIKGADLEVSYLPIENFQVDIGLAWLDATYDTFDTLLNGSSFDASGNSLALSPEFTSNIALEYRYPKTIIGGEIGMRVDFYHSSEKYFDQFNDPRTRQGTYNLFNARIAYTSADEKWLLAAYGKNLTDELVFTSAFTFGLLADGYIASLAPPRTYGAELTYRF